MNNQRMLAAALEVHQLEHGKGAENWSDIVGPEKALETMPVCAAGGVYNGATESDGSYLVTCTIAGHHRETAAAARAGR